jgi:hypothetical protein
MGGVLHRCLVATIAAALIVSGATWRACIAEHLPPAAPASAHPSHAQHSHIALHERHGDDGAAHLGVHHHGAESQPQHATDDGQPALGDHACLKCCSMCTVASVMPADPNPGVTFIISAVLFSAAQSHCSDRVVLIDPGIPKRIV